MRRWRRSSVFKLTSSDHTIALLLHHRSTFPSFLCSRFPRGSFASQHTCFSLSPRLSSSALLLVGVIILFYNKIKHREGRKKYYVVQCIHRITGEKRDPQNKTTRKKRVSAERRSKGSSNYTASRRSTNISRETLRYTSTVFHFHYYTKASQQRKSSFLLLQNTPQKLQNRLPQDRKNRWS